jgi:tetratricopeptide (TPR) repeat protein
VSILSLSILMWALSTPAPVFVVEARAATEEASTREQEARAREEEVQERADEVYDQATESLDEEQWEQAIRLFGEAGRLDKKRADGALYWKAYAQSKRGQRADALATLGELRKSYPTSRWLGDAKALEAEVQRAAGRPPSPEAEGDDDVRLLALDGLLNADPERAIPMIEKILAGTASSKLKDRALFVLCQSNSPRAREIVGRLARFGSPDVQRRALRYLGIFGGAESRKILAEVYAASSDAEIKQAILQSFMVSGDRAQLLAAARSEKSPELRRTAIHQLGAMGAQGELLEMYRDETSLELRKAVIEAITVGGNADKLLELARMEKQPELRLMAVRGLGMLGAAQTASALVSLYASERDHAVKLAVIEAFMVQGNAKALVELARKETDPALKKEIVASLSRTGGKEAADYLMELLDK